MHIFPCQQPQHVEEEKVISWSQKKYTWSKVEGAWEPTIWFCHFHFIDGERTWSRLHKESRCEPPCPAKSLLLKHSLHVPAQAFAYIPSSWISVLLLIFQGLHLMWPPWWSFSEPSAGLLVPLSVFCGRGWPSNVTLIIVYLGVCTLHMYSE